MLRQKQKTEENCDALRRNSLLAIYQLSNSHVICFLVWIAYVSAHYRSQVRVSY